MNSYSVALSGMVAPPIKAAAEPCVVAVSYAPSAALVAHLDES
jgi:hypothetical protein